MTETLIRMANPCADGTCLAATGYTDELPPRPYDRPELWCGSCWERTSQFERFHLLYDPRLRRFIAFKVSRWAKANTPIVVDDVDQDTMLTIFASWGKLTFPERAMFTIARRRIYKVVKDYQPEEPTEDEQLHEIEDTSAIDALEQVEDHDQVHRALEQLPSRTRSYVLEHKGQGETAEAVGRRHGVHPSTVKTSTKRGLIAMAGWMLQVVAPFVLAIVQLLPEGVERALNDAAEAFMTIVGIVGLIAFFVLMAFDGRGRGDQ